MAAAEATELVLASTSRYRRELLARYGLPFTTLDPGVDEAAHPGETAAALAARLARAKAHAVAARRPGAVVIGSDQVAELEGTPLGKPGNHANAVAQLRRCSGRSVRFHTAVCVLDARSAQAIEFTDLTQVDFRELDDEEIERYLQHEPAYDCAGSFKCEGLGAVLFRAILGSDPTALVGLPLLALADALRRCGYRLP